MTSSQYSIQRRPTVERGATMIAATGSGTRRPCLGGCLRDAVFLCRFSYCGDFFAGFLLAARFCAGLRLAARFCAGLLLAARFCAGLLLAARLPRFFAIDSRPPAFKTKTDVDDLLHYHYLWSRGEQKATRASQNFPDASFNKAPAR